MRVITVLIFSCLSAIFIFSCADKTMRDEPVRQQEPAPKPMVVEFKTYEHDGGWGYDIYVDGAPYIRQPNIPAVNGLHTFKTEHDAQLVAGAVAEKIRNNIIPPSITIEEMQALGIVIE